LISQRRNNASYFYHYDGLGSTKALTDANQNIQNTTKYDAWGNILQSSGTITNPYLYVGELGYYGDGDAGMYLLTQRWYNPVIGRFVVRDPLQRREEESSSSGLYLYSANNPVNFYDPLGLFTKKFCKDWYDKCLETAKENLLDCWKDILGVENTGEQLFQGVSCWGACLIGCLLSPPVLYEECSISCAGGCLGFVNFIIRKIAAVQCGRLYKKELAECRELYERCCAVAKQK
jgi:RHS repeat-associated protein